MAILTSRAPFSWLLGGLGPDTFNLSTSARLAVVDPGAGGSQVMQDSVVIADAPYEDFGVYRTGDHLGAVGIDTASAGANTTLLDFYDGARNVYSTFTFTAATPEQVGGPNDDNRPWPDGDGIPDLDQVYNLTFGTPGADTITAPTSLTFVDAVYGGAGNDTLTGSLGVSAVIGNGGDDDLRAGSSLGTAMLGGSGNDTYRLDPNAFAIVWDTGGGTDQLVATSLDFAALDVATIDGLHLAVTNPTGTTGFIILNYAANPIESIFFAGDVPSSPHTQAQILAAYPSAPDLSWEALLSYVPGLGLTADEIRDFLDVMTVFEGDDQGPTLNITLGGTDANDTLLGYSGDNTVIGDAGDDFLAGAGGDDVLAGGAGADTMNGGPGTDTASYAGSSGAVQVNLTGGFANGAEAAGDRLMQIENLIGSAFGDVLFGSAAANRLDGGPGNDTLVGADGNDVLIGGAGADHLNGGAGTDTALYAGASGAVRVNLTGGFANGAEAGGDTLVLIENLVGSAFGDVLFGSAAANRLEGGAGNDTLVGAAGNDVLIGGAGADDLNGGAGIDFADYSGSSGAVQVNLTSGFANGAEAAGDTLALIENLVGSGFGDVLFGSAAANRLEGGAGNDILVGAAGADTLIAAAGNDVLIGGAGADDLNGGAGNDTALYTGASGAVRVNLTSGFANGAEAAGDTLVLIENLVGSGFDDLLFGSAAANRLVGGAGNDTLVGAAGNDVLIGGAGGDDLNGGAGIDFADYSGSSGAVQVNLTSGFANGAEAAGDTLALIENLVGSGFGDVLFGSAAANRLAGAAGNDILVGAAGADTLIGNAGADTLNGGAGSDTFVYMTTAGSAPTAFDTILGFSSAQNDVIDVSAVDANAALGGNQDFAFIGTAAFTAAGQLRFDAAFDFGGSVGPAVLGTTDADLDPEFVISVPGVAAMTAGDFVLS